MVGEGEGGRWTTLTLKVREKRSCDRVIQQFSGWLSNENPRMRALLVGTLN